VAQPQKEQGYTPIAHEILEEIAKHRLNGTQFRIILIVWRYTYGFNRKEHAMSIGFLADALGIRKNRVETELNILLFRNILTAKRNGNRARIISFNKDYDTWIDPDEYPRIQGYEKKSHTPEYRDTIPQNSGVPIPPYSGTKKEKRKY
jgi:phage replication O-like protein O